MCMYCKCDKLKLSTMTHTVDLGEYLIIIRNVPCEECVQCGARFYNDDVVAKLERIVKGIMSSIQGMVVVDYDKAA